MKEKITTKQKKELIKLFAKMCQDFMLAMDKYFSEKEKNEQNRN